MSDYELFRAGCWHDLVFESEEVNKFWSIKIHKNTHIRKWGVTGTTGKELVTEFSEAEEARFDAKRLYESKIKGGYRVAKPELKKTTELTHFVEYDELERFFNQVYQKDNFEFVADQEASNDSSHRFHVTGEMSDWDREQVQRYIEEDDLGLYMTQYLLDDCARQKLIPAGIYVVEVSW